MPLHEPFEEKYEILEKIGQGGMGAVYKVRHRLLDELRVIKVIRSPLEPTPEAEERFLREARMASRLRHPNLAVLHDFALSEDGRAYIVLEHIEGATLRELLERLGPPPLPLALEIARQAAMALQYLHRQRIVHRDISPGNLMLTRDFEGGPLVKLIDLGLSRSLESGTDGLTRGLFVGKVRYASPEQFDEGPVDERSDLYSLGVVLYELATGRCPIAGHDARTWMAAHLFRPPLGFAESDPEGQVPEDLRAVLLRLLAKSPDDRFASAEELAQSVREVQARFPLRGDELDGVFGGASEEPSLPDGTGQPQGLPLHNLEPGTGQPRGLPLPNLEPEAATETVGAGLVPALGGGAPLEPESSVSLLLQRPVRAEKEESVSIPLVLGAGAAARLADDPSWDRAPRPREDDGFLYEPLQEAGEPAAAPRPVPVRRSGLLLPLAVGVFSLAIIFTLVALYSVTSEFRLGRVESGIEEVTEPVAPPAEETEETEEAKETTKEAEDTREPETQPAPPVPTAETPLIEEISGDAEPEPETAPEPERETRSARREPVRTDPPRAVPERTEEPARKVAQAPARRQPVVREGGVRPGPNVMPPIPLDSPRFSYPAAARGQGLDIDVRLDLLVDENGKVIDAVVREGDTSGLGFNETALAAARRLTFQPATRGDEPVKMWTEMIFQFSEPETARRSGR